MTDEPDAVTLIGIVAQFLRDVVEPKLSGMDRFRTRVAANALLLSARELEQSRRLENEAINRLKALLALDADVRTLERALAEQIAYGKLDESSRELMDHLWADVLGKLSVDQPNYPSYRAELKFRSDAKKSTS